MNEFKEPGLPNRGGRLPHSIASAPYDTAFASRLSVPSRVANVEPALRLQAIEEAARLAVFKSMVSAACYVSLAPSNSTSASLEAVQILHDCLQEMLDEGVNLGSSPAEIEDLIWSDKQRAWEGYFATANTNKSAPLQVQAGSRFEKLLEERASKAFAAQKLYGVPGRKPYCARCDDYSLRRIERRSFWTRTVLTRLGLFPWECVHCQRKVMLRQREVVHSQDSLQAMQQPFTVNAIPALHYLSRAGKAKPEEMD